jgi:hypothetical protein
MTAETFDDLLRKWVRRDPFQPFTIVKANGERIKVDVPTAIAFDGGGGGFITPDGDVLFFECEEVQELKPAACESTA